MQINQTAEVVSSVDIVAESTISNLGKGADALPSSVTEESSTSDVKLETKKIDPKENCRDHKLTLKGGTDKQNSESRIEQSKSNRKSQHKPVSPSIGMCISDTHCLENSKLEDAQQVGVIKPGITVPATQPQADRSHNDKPTSVLGSAEDVIELKQNDIENICTGGMLKSEHTIQTDRSPPNVGNTCPNTNPGTCGTVSDTQANNCQIVMSKRQTEVNSKTKKDLAVKPMLNDTGKMEKKSPDLFIKPELENTRDVKSNTVEVTTKGNGTNVNSTTQKKQKRTNLKQRPKEIRPSTTSNSQPSPVFGTIPQPHQSQIPSQLHERKPSINYQPVSHHSNSAPHSVSHSGQCINSMGHHPAYPVKSSQAYGACSMQQKDIGSTFHNKMIGTIEVPPNVNPYYNPHTGQISIAEPLTKSPAPQAYMTSMGSMNRENRTPQHSHQTGGSCYTLHPHSSPQSQRMPNPHCDVGQSHRLAVQHNGPQPMQQLPPQPRQFSAQQQQFVPHPQSLPTQTHKFPTPPQVFPSQPQQVAQQVAQQVPPTSASTSASTSTPAFPMR